MARVSSHSGLVAAPQATTNLTRPMAPQLVPQAHLHGHWRRRNHPLPYTHRQHIVTTGVQDLPLAQALPHCQPEVCQLERSVCTYN